jgi:hypothetical protein
MQSTVGDFRRWLIGLSDDAMRELLGAIDLFRDVACSQSRGRAERSPASKRDIRAARAWLPNAPAKTLVAVAGLGATLAVRCLIEELAYSAEAVSDPTTDQLEAMLSALPPVQARTALYGMVLAEVRASAVARASEELLRRAADRDPVPDLGPRPEQTGSQLWRDGRATPHGPKADGEAALASGEVEGEQLNGDGIHTVGPGTIVPVQHKGCCATFDVLMTASFDLELSCDGQGRSDGVGPALVFMSSR